MNVQFENGKLSRTGFKTSFQFFRRIHAGLELTELLFLSPICCTGYVSADSSAPCHITVHSPFIGMSVLIHFLGEMSILPFGR